MKPIAVLFPSQAASPPAAPFIPPELDAMRRNGLPSVPPFPGQGPQPFSNLSLPIQAPLPAQGRPAPIQPSVLSPNPAVPPQAFKPNQSAVKPGQAVIIPPNLPAQVPIPPQTKPAAVAPQEESKSPPKGPALKPKPLPLLVEETKEVKPSPKKQGRRQNDPTKSQPESPKGLQRPAKNQLFPDKSQPPSPKRLKDPCQSCRQAESTVVITSNGETPLKVCDECAKGYTDVLPLVTFPKLTSRDIIDFAVEKFEYVKSIKKQIEENLTRIDKFKAKAEKEFEEVSKELQKCKTRIFDKVTALRRDIESKLTTALAEIEANLCNFDYNPRTEYALVMWEKRVEDVNFALFVSRCSTPDVVGEVTRTIDYEVNGLIALNCIPIITDNQIVKFHCKREEWCPSIPLQSEIHVSDHSVFTFIGGQDILCTGGHSDEEDSLVAFDTAYIVNMATGNAETLKNMETARYRHGAVWIGQNVYMFGGENPDFLSVCEKLCLNHRDRPWSKLREMASPRSCFNPFVKERLIYIMGGSNTHDCELYDFVKNTFLPLSFFLPDSLPVTAVLLLPNIYIFQGSQGLKWDPSHKSTKSTSITRDLPYRNREESEEIDVWSNFSPLLISGRLYLSCNQAQEVVRQEMGGRFAVHSFPFL